MNTREALRQQIDRAVQQLSLLEEFGDDIWEDGNVLGWDMQFQPGGKSYTYIAVRAGSCWYMTGREAGRRLTWSDLVAWWISHQMTVDRLYIVSRWSTYPQS